MKKFIVLSIVLLMLVGFAITSSATVADKTQSKLPLEEVVSITAATLMPLDGTWITIDEYMTAPAFFLTGSPWTWDSGLPVKFTITDIWVVTDRFEVYDGGSYVIETPNLLDWDALMLPGSHFSPPYTGDPDTALADGRFSCAVIYFAVGSHSITIRDIHIPLTGLNGPFPDGTVAFKAELSEMAIDIKPGSDPNSINLKSKGVVPVAVLTTDLFDAATVDPTTVEFAGASPVRWVMEDVDGDGDLDMLFHFSTQELVLDAFSTEAYLTGEATGGVLFGGVDSVNIVGK